MAGQPRTRAKKALAAMEKAASEQADVTPPLDDPPGSLHTASDEGSRDKPPRRAASRRAAGSASSSASIAEPDRRPASIRKIEDGLTNTFVLAGLGLSMIDAFDGQVIALNAKRLSRAWADLAQQSPQVRKALEALLGGSAWGAALGQTAMVAVPILVRHGYAPINLAAMAAANGVELPVIEEPAPPADVGPGVVGPEVPPSDEVREHAQREPRHPFDGSPLDEPAAPSAPVQFPHNPDDVGKGRG